MIVLFVGSPVFLPKYLFSFISSAESQVGVFQEYGSPNKGSLRSNKVSSIDSW